MRVKIQHLILIVIGTIAGLILGEIILSVLDYPKGYKMILVAIEEVKERKFAKWWVYDPKVGTKFDRDHITKDILLKATGISANWKRLSIVNKDGYHDKDEFVKPSQSKLKILVLGDSFAWGASSDIGFSFVELFEKMITQDNPSALVWNTAIPACGTNQQILILRKYHPIMDPDFVILCFFENDFYSNIRPLDEDLRTESGIIINQYQYDKCQRRYLKLDNERILERLNKRYVTEYGDWIQKTRIGYIILNNIMLASYKPQKFSLANHLVGQTTGIIKAIQKYTHEHGSQLVVLTIPSRKTVILKGINSEYLAIRKILTENSIKFLDPIALLSKKDYQPLPDSHWNNSGHQKVGYALYAMFRELLAARSPDNVSAY